MQVQRVVLAAREQVIRLVGLPDVPEVPEDGEGTPLDAVEQDIFGPCPAEQGLKLIVERAEGQFRDDIAAHLHGAVAEVGGVAVGTQFPGFEGVLAESKRGGVDADGFEGRGRGRHPVGCFRDLCHCMEAAVCHVPILLCAVSSTS